MKQLWMAPGTEGCGPLNRETDLFIARIVENATGKVQWQSKPTTERMAEKMAGGASTNLNWEKFSAEVVFAEGEGKD